MSDINSLTAAPKSRVTIPMKTNKKTCHTGGTTRNVLRKCLVSALLAAFLSVPSTASADKILNTSDVVLTAGGLLVGLVTIGASVRNGVAVAQDERSPTPWVVTGAVGGGLHIILGGVQLAYGVSAVQSKEVLFRCDPSGYAVLTTGPCKLHPASVPERCACTEPGDSGQLIFGTTLLALGGLAIGLAIAGANAGGEPASVTSNGAGTSPAALPFHSPLFHF